MAAGLVDKTMLKREQVKREQIAVIIPALNEADNLRWLLPELVQRYRVIVVDNGSTDDTAQVARSLGAEVQHCPQRGYGRAVLAGMHHLGINKDSSLSGTHRLTQGKSAQKPGHKSLDGQREAKQVGIVVIFDGDGTSPWSEIDTICAPILSGDKDMVIAQRQLCDRGAMPHHARMGNSLTVWLIRLFTGYDYSDMGPLRAVKADKLSFLQMEDQTWGWNVEMQMKAAALGLRIAEVPIRYAGRRFGRSKISGSWYMSIRAGVKILWACGYYYLKVKAMLRRPEVKQALRSSLTLSS